MILPGWRSTLRVSPLRHSLDLSATLPLHGALSLVLDQPHGKRPSFVLVPREVLRPHLRDLRDPLWAFRAEEWDVHWLHPGAVSLGESSHRVEMFGALRLLTLGPLHAMEVPWPEPGRYRVVLDSLTPFIMRRGQHEGEGEYRRMTGALLLGAVHANLKKLLPPGEAAAFEGLRLRSQGVDFTYLPFSTGWSTAVRGGLLFRAEVEVDALGLLALRVLAELGMGTYVSRGFGRVRLGKVERLDT